MDWKKFIEDAQEELAVYSKALPETMQGFGKMGKAAKGGSALDTKTKELIALGYAIRSQCKHCIAYHARNLSQTDVRREEVAEALAMCAYMGGGPAINYGAMALQAFDQFRE